MSIHDSAATVESAVRSVIYQTLAAWELVLIDDGSHDDGASRVAKLCDPRISIVRHNERKGLAPRLNEAVALSRGKFIARMDADDICYPERLKVQVAFLQANAEVDLVASKALVFRGAGKIVGVMVPPIAHGDIIACPYDGFVFPHPTWCGRAAWFREHKYDETMPITQDQELLLRTAQHSRFATVDKILLGYRKEEINLSRSARGRMLFCRAMWRHAQKTGARVRAIAYVAKQMAKFAAEVTARSIGAERSLLQWKFGSSLTAEETARWSALWCDVCGASEMGSEMQNGVAR